MCDMKGFCVTGLQVVKNVECVMNCKKTCNKEYFDLIAPCDQCLH